MTQSSFDFPTPSEYALILVTDQLLEALINCGKLRTDAEARAPAIQGLTTQS